MLYKRQRVLLSLLDAFGGRLGMLDFQKLLFLFCEETKQQWYDFVPYKFGGFSFTSYADKRKLVQKSFLKDDDSAWVLTAEGAQVVESDDLSRYEIQAFAEAYATLRGKSLVREVYRRYPWYATRSEIAEELFQEQPEVLRRISEAQPLDRTSGIFTIGYEARSLESYLNNLLKNGVNILCDVRRNPLSRKYGFSKKGLSAACGKLDIGYEHLTELGIDGADRRDLKSLQDYQLLFERYKNETLRNQDEALREIKRWVSQGHRVALTCYELHPHQCHRHCVAEALERKFGKKFKPCHL